jgi:hypothetical protein
MGRGYSLSGYKLNGQQTVTKQAFCQVPPAGLAIAPQNKRSRPSISLRYNELATLRNCLQPM